MDGTVNTQPIAQLRASGWIQLADSRELGRRVLVRRTHHNGRELVVLLWRTRAGNPVAMDAECPHRALSMEGARLIGDALECPVHRRVFGSDGLCINRPDGKPAVLLQVRELHGSIWLSPK